MADPSARDPGRLEVPSGIAALDPNAVERIESLVAEAEQRQVLEMVEAAGAALDQLPGVLRRLMLRILGV
jgi:hypothetical protein